MPLGVPPAFKPRVRIHDPRPRLLAPLMSEYYVSQISTILTFYVAHANADSVGRRGARESCPTGQPLAGPPFEVPHGRVPRPWRCKNAASRVPGTNTPNTPRRRTLPSALVAERLTNHPGPHGIANGIHGTRWRPVNREGVLLARIKHHVGAHGFGFKKVRGLRGSSARV